MATTIEKLERFVEALRSLNNNQSAEDYVYQQLPPAYKVLMAFAEGNGFNNHKTNPDPTAQNGGD